MTYVNPASVQGTSITFVIISVLIVIARFYVRFTKNQKLALDDWFIVPALIGALASFTTILVGCYQHGIGYHSDPPDPYVPPFLSAPHIVLEKVEFAVTVIFVPTIGFTRLSVLYFYKRIFSGKIFTTISWILIALTSGWIIAFTFVLLFECKTDFKANWSLNPVDQAKCFNSLAASVAMTVTDVALDLSVLILPFPLVWALQMPTEKKVGVSFTFLLGFFSIAAGTIRMAMIIYVNYISRPGENEPVLGLPSYDVIGIVSLVLFWQLVQVGVALATANLLTLRPLVRGFSMESMFSGLRSRGSFRFSVREKRDWRRSNEFAVHKKIEYSESEEVEDPSALSDSGSYGGGRAERHRDEETGLGVCNHCGKQTMRRHG